ncbi:MAG: toll/interleukin-1 receptor domain-containing protein [Xanthobacteraceae bacterium]
MSVSHLFVCFSSKDEAVAREVVESLEADDLKCWISLRDVLPGQNYQEAIVQALESASGIVFLFSEHSNKSQEIRKELSIGGSINVPVFPLRLSPIAASGALRYELAIRQWIDIFPHRQHALARLAQTIKDTINRSATSESHAPPHRPAAKKRAPASAPAPRGPIIVSGTPQFETIRALLARHIGPIAKVFIDRAANGAHSPDEFCEQLANHVPAPADRAAFVRAVREQLGKT